MARVVRTILVPGKRDEVFSFVADFSKVAEWDPGVESSRRLTDEALVPGARFHVVSRFLGSRIDLVYTVREIEVPGRVVLEAETGSVRSLDEIRFEDTPRGTRIVYDARLEPKGLLRLADPLLQLVFSRLGDAAIGGLQEKLGRVE